MNTMSETRSARTELESAVIRFAGDSGDGMQLTGGRFTLSTALAGNDLATFPDFPAEIRAPAGTLFGVSAFQINFGAHRVLTAGDALDVLIAMNPAALKVHLPDLKPGGMVIVDRGAFTDRNLAKAGYDSDPLEDESLNGISLLSVDMSKLTLEAVKTSQVSKKDGQRTKNIWALGLVYWLYNRDRAPTIDWLQAKFAKRPEIAAANIAALNAGHAFGETAELPGPSSGGYMIPPASIPAGEYRTLTGTEALAWGLTVGAQLADLSLSFCSYPITPASALLHELARLEEYGIQIFQAEDEIAAVCAAIGASYAGALGVTSSSGPGLALKMEAIGLAIMAELPLVVVNSQRGGPSTGLPTKTEQSDLYQAVWGRNGDAPLVVLAASSPIDAFNRAIESIRLALRYMTPVILLSDGYISNASEPWLIPDVSKIDPFPAQFHIDQQDFQPYARNPDTGARPWVVPGTPGLIHRIGGLEKDATTGNISYDPANHQRMTDLRAIKIAGIAQEIPPQTISQGPDSGRLVVVGWGSTAGPISRAVSLAQEEGFSVSHIHLHHLWPLPANLADLLDSFEKILVPEMNNGQLATLLRSQFTRSIDSLPKVMGTPFRVDEITAAIRSYLC